MRKREGVAEAAFGCIGGHGTVLARMFAVPAREADARARLTQNDRLTQNRFQHLLLRQSQVLDFKGALTQRRK